MKDISTAIRELVRRRAGTMDHVTVLLALRETDSPMTLNDIEVSSGIKAATITRCLADLTEGQLVRHDPRIGSYAYSASAGDRLTVDALAVIYHQLPLTLVKFFQDLPAEKLRHFSEAFRLRHGSKEPSDPENA